MNLFLIIFLIFFSFIISLNATTVYNKDENIFKDGAMPRAGILPPGDIEVSNGAVVNFSFTPTSVPDDFFTGAFLRAAQQNTTYRGDGELNFFFDGTKVPAASFKWGIFVYRDALAVNGNITFDVNASFRVADNSNIGRGMFIENGITPDLPLGSFVFNKNLFVDINNAKPNSAGRRQVFMTEVNGRVFVNSNPDTHQIVNPDNIIQLKGDIFIGTDSQSYINLSNASSFFMGRFFSSLPSDSNISLKNGAKWYLTGLSNLETLDIINPSLPSEGINAKNSQNLSIIDLSSYATATSSGMYCPNDDCPRLDEAFNPRVLRINNLNGENGVFRLLVNIQSRQSDKIEVGNLNGKHYIQIYQDPTNIVLDGKNLVVASATSLGDGGDFEGIGTMIGLYSYTPFLQKTSGASGVQWLLGSVKPEPNQTAKSLLNLFSLPYEVFRIEGDLMHIRVDDLVYPPTLNGLWMKVYGGGIYEKQPYGEKTTQNLFYSFQGGYDKGETNEDIRSFYGGSLDYTKLYASDKGFDGHSNSIAFGGYGGYIDQKGWVLDGSIKYVYSALSADMFESTSPLRFGSHIFLASGRVGYNFYPFFRYRDKTIERCVQKAFCRNEITQTKVRDETFYFQPYFSLTPALILGSHTGFEDKAHSNIHAKLDFSPALITKMGVLVLKRYDYLYSSLNLRGLIEYSNDMNLGGNITLIDDANIPINHNSKLVDNRLGFGIGTDWLFLNDSLKLHLDFKSEFFGHINTYWLLTAGFRYKFGQKAPRAFRSLNLRPMTVRTQKVAPRSFVKTLKPYEEKDNSNKTFYENNHFKPYGEGNKKYSKPPQSPKAKNPESSNAPLLRPSRPWQSTRPVRK